VFGHAAAMGRIQHRLEGWSRQAAGWSRQAARALPVRCARRFARIGGRDRSLVIAGESFTTVVPLLIIVASISGSDGGSTVGEDLVARFHLSGDSADAVRTLFGRPPNASGAVSVIGLAIVFVSLLALARSLQRTYEAAWGLPPCGARGKASGLAGMLLLVVQLVVSTLVASALRDLPASQVVTVTVRLIEAVPLWLAVHYLLLTRRVPIRLLIPGAVFAAAGQVVVSMYSALWMPRAVATNAAQYGLIGVTFALLTWLIVVSFAIVASAAVAAELAASAQPQGGGR
jgi:membrane protein